MMSCDEAILFTKVNGVLLLIDLIMARLAPTTRTATIGTALFGIQALTMIVVLGIFAYQHWNLKP